MSSSRLQNQHQVMKEEEEEQKLRQNSQGDSDNANPKNKSPGRPRGRGRPKLSLNMINKKKSQEEAFQEEIPKPRERIIHVKEENQIEGYVRIVDYLKKIQCDDVSFQNKMNPFHALTANSFWYMISAEYFSYDFFARNNPTQASNNIINKVMKLPVQIPLRIIKNIHSGKILEFQTEQVRQLGKQLSQKMAHLIPPATNINKSQNYEKRLNLTSVSQDDEFISSTRALLFKYVKNQIKSCQNWHENLNPLLQSQFSLRAKLFQKFPPLDLQQKSEQPQEIKSLDELTRQNKKKKSKSSKQQIESQQQIKTDKNAILQIQDDDQNLNTQKNQENRRPLQINQSRIVSDNSRIVSDSSDNQPQKNLKIGQKKLFQEENVQIQQFAEEDRRIIINQVENERPLLMNGSQKMEVQQDNLAQQKGQDQNEKSSSNNIGSFLKHYTTDQILLSSILQLPLQKVISLLESTLTLPQMPMIEQSFMPIPKSDPLEFIFNLHQAEQSYLDYMKLYQRKIYHQKKKKSETKFQQEFREDQFQDAKCQICTDGDYTDDNLIVFCSTCNISLHQRCVGLAKVPAQSWVCDLCLAFGPAGVNVPCPLCNVKGGALKRTNIHIDSTLFKQTNPGYFQFSKRCPYSKQKQEYVFNPNAENNKAQKIKQQQDKRMINNQHQQLQKKVDEKMQLQMLNEASQQKQAIADSLNKKQLQQHKQQQIPNLDKLKLNNDAKKNIQNRDANKSQIGMKKKKSQSISPNQKEQKQQLYYDYFNKKTYPLDQPACHYVWVHYVCAIWIPECYFQEKNGSINIRGIENIQKKRFRHQCIICKKTKAGACVKCEDADCDKYYHPECARKSKVYMEQLNLQKIKYLIFCQEHQPLKITRQIQYKKKKSRQEIVKFARMIEKYVDTYKIANFPFKLMKINPGKSFIQTNDRQEIQSQSISVKVQIVRQTDQQFIKDIILKLSKAKRIIIKLQKIPDGIKIEEIQQPTRRQFRKCLNRYDDFWHTLSNGQSVEQNFKRFQKIMKENFYLKQKTQIFLNGGPVSISSTGKAKQQKTVKKGKVRGRSANIQKETMIEEGTFNQLQKEGGIFCVCRKPYQNQVDMLECEVCSQWYHFKCIGFLGNQDDAQNIQFHCMKCMKFQGEQQKNPRLQVCRPYFSQDSLFLNYRPPTPQLLSEQQDNIQQNQREKETIKQIKIQEQQKVNRIKDQQQQKKNQKARRNIQKSSVKIDNSKVKNNEKKDTKSAKFSNVTKEQHQKTLKNFVAVSKQPVEKLVENLKNFKSDK